jgi:hypothetical protein
MVSSTHTNNKLIIFNTYQNLFWKIHFVLKNMRILFPLTRNNKIHFIIQNKII